jgi:HAD superfamily hydrolase (TIGR01509 family)
VRKKQVTAVIFDMDGVLFDTEAYYQRLIHDFFAELGLEIPIEELWRLPGQSDQVYQDVSMGWWGHVEGLTDEERAAGPFERFDAYCEERKVPAEELLNPGVVETLAALNRAGIVLALASSSSVADIDALIDPTDIRRFFSVIVSGEDFTESKPNPAIYLHTLQELGMEAEDVVAVEDSDTGIEAAVSAGLEVVAKRERRFGFTQEGATWAIDRIPELLGIVEPKHPVTDTASE